MSEKTDIERMAAWHRGLASMCKLTGNDQEYSSFIGTAEKLDRLASIICSQGKLCDGGYNCEKDHRFP